MILYSILLLVVTFSATESNGAKSQSTFDNAIIGQPSISCQRDRIVIEVITERLFTGKVFVKGDYANPQCTKTFRNGVVTSDKPLEEPFLGTVKKSREPYVEDQRSTTKTLSDGREPIFELDSTTEPRKTFETHENELPPDIAAAFLLPRRNLTAESLKSDSDEGEWQGIGGVSTGGNAVFGGTRGEELRVFGKGGGSSATPRGRPATTASPLASSNCPPPTTCAPCVCEERRTRRATNSIRLEVPLNSCNTKRDRKLNPPSVVVSLIAVVSFHDSFITKLDKAYHIQCAYAEAEKTVSTDLDVNMNDEHEINGTMEPPSCDYLISDSNGNSVQNSLVGELVRHQWTCKGGMASKLKMLIHQCFVKDGAGQQFEVIDEHGCTLDRLMLQTPTYSADGMTAQVDAYIFKFPDRSTVDFRCTITFCSVDDAECLEMTPPKCNLSNNSLRRKRSTKGLSSMSLHANSLTVFDIDSSKSDNSQLLHSSSFLRSSLKDYGQTFCVSVASFGILISASTFFATISIAVIVSYFVLRFNHKLLIVN